MALATEATGASPTQDAGYETTQWEGFTDQENLEWLVDAVHNDIATLRVSTDGLDIPINYDWVPQETWENLATALADAESRLSDAATDNRRLRACYSALSVAWQAAMDQRKPGTASTQDSFMGGAGDGIRPGGYSITPNNAVDVELFELETVEQDGAEFVAGEVLVIFEDDASKGRAYTDLMTVEDVDKSQLAVEISQADFSEPTEVVVVALEEGADVISAVQALEGESSVAVAQPNYVYTLFEEVGVEGTSSEPPGTVDDAEGGEGSNAGVAGDDDNTAGSSDANTDDDDDASGDSGNGDGDDGNGDGNTKDNTVSITPPGVGTIELDPRPGFGANPGTTTVVSRFVPNDPFVANTVGGSTRNAWHLEAINAFEAWSTARANRLVTAVVLDSGCRLDHEDLRNQLWTEYAYNSYSNTPLTGDTTGHGTHVAGIIAAEANNALGTAGVSYNAMVLPICVFDTTGTKCTTSSLTGAYDYLMSLAEELNIHVVNMSFGSHRAPNATDLALQAKIQQALQLNIATVAAAGNGDGRVGTTTTVYPSDFAECVSVTALDYNTDMPAAWCDYNENKDICAPGMHIWSTVATTASSYASKSGTSMAAPVVAAAMALLWAVDPNLTVDEAKQILYDTATPLTVPEGREGMYGVGILDLEAAVAELPSLVVEADSSYVTSGQQLQMRVRFLGQNSTDNSGTVTDLPDTTPGEDEEPAPTIAWAVQNGTGTATIDAETGLLTALMPGSVTVVAAYADNPACRNSMQITVEAAQLSAQPQVTVTASSLEIAWGEAPFATGYILERAGADGEYSTLADTRLTSFTDETAQIDVPYSYRVTPYTSVGRSGTGTASVVAKGMRMSRVTAYDEQDVLTSSTTAVLAEAAVLAGLGKQVDTLIVVPSYWDAWPENAASLAAATNGIVLPVEDELLSQQVLDAIQQMNITRLIVLDGCSLVPAQVVTQLESVVSAYAERVSHSDRQQFATETAKMALAAATQGAPAQLQSAVIVASLDDVEALAGVANVQSAFGAPVLYVRPADGGNESQLYEAFGDDGSEMEMPGEGEGDDEGDEGSNEPTQAPFDVETLLTARHYAKAYVLTDNIDPRALGYLQRQDIEIIQLQGENWQDQLTQQLISQGAVSASPAAILPTDNLITTQVAAALAAQCGGVLLPDSTSSLTLIQENAGQVATVVVCGEATRAQQVKALVEGIFRGQPVSDGTFTVSEDPYAAGYALVMYEGAVPEGSAVCVSGNLMYAAAGQPGAFQYLLPMAQAQALTQQDFSVVANTQPLQLAAPGDINGNGTVNIVDAVIVLDLANNVYPDFTRLSMAAWLAADANADTRIDAQDAFLILRNCFA